LPVSRLGSRGEEDITMVFAALPLSVNTDVRYASITFLARLVLDSGDFADLARVALLDMVHTVTVCIVPAFAAGVTLGNVIGALRRHV